MKVSKVLKIAAASAGALVAERGFAYRSQSTSANSRWVRRFSSKRQQKQFGLVALVAYDSERASSLEE
jgi:hypothetical protein